MLHPGYKNPEHMNREAKEVRVKIDTSLFTSDVQVLMTIWYTVYSISAHAKT